MPLVRIEVCDFKSYRGHQTIGPFSHFTSVIGPNGAGKSNLMDAISFVVGIKSAQLRSSQLKDLVYRGRRLTAEEPSGTVDEEEDEEDEEVEGEGTAKKAWVLAVFVDDKKKEWRFQRTISTTGASEYRLNNKVVTYGAYQTALASHNILVKAKNFLVFQGDVEAVASQSPTALSKLIDQISGSLELKEEYDKAKEKQEKAIEKSTENFGKRRGIAGEIKQYKEQKNEAERFEGMCQEKDALILHRILYRLYHIEESIESSATFIKSKNRELSGLRAEQKTHEKALEASRAEQAKARSAVMGVEKKVKRGEKDLEGKRPDLVAINAQITHSQRKLENAQKTSTQVVRDSEALKDKVKKLKTELQSIKKMAAEAQEAQRKASQHNLSLSEESLEEYRRLKAQANLLAIPARQSLETLLRDSKTQSRSLAQLKDKQEQDDNRRIVLEGDESTLLEKEETLEAKVKELQNQLAKVKQELDNAQSERTRIKQLEGEANEKLQEVLHQLLQAGVEKGESERDAKLKETLSNLQRVFPGVRGRLIDLCKPTQRKYETAVTVILGRNIDAVVVDEEKTAIECIEYMRTQRAGQATFIPLDTIQVKPINDKFRSFAKGARLAVDVIQFDSNVERAMHHACGNSLVCDSMEVARYVCYEKGQEVKAVTLEGTIIHKSGLITGGRSTHSSKKWDEKDVQGLRRARDTLMAQLQDLLKQRPRGKADEGLISEVTRLESAIIVTRDDLNACKSRLNGVKDELKHIQKELKKSHPEVKKAQAAFNIVQSKLDELKAVINEAEDDVFSDFCEKIGVVDIREYEERQLKVAQEESEARLRFDTQISRLTHQFEWESEQLKGISDRLQNFRKVVETQEATLTKLQDQKADTEADIKNAEENLKELQVELKKLQEVLEEKTKNVENVKRTTSKASKGLDGALKEIASMNDKIEQLASERSSAYRKCRLEEIKLPLLEGNLKNVPMEENLREEVAMDIDEDEDGTQHVKKVPNYGIEVDFDSLEDEDREDPGPEHAAKLDAAIVKLTGEIERMAPNMKAIDRLDDVEHKLAETEKEADKARKDSRSARDEFNDVKKRRCELFNKAYNHISERIDQVYKDLTKGKASPMGGVAYLSLEDSEEPYAAGIKYHAMPPMKRFRDMEQLSGGEKTVAAMALLFAIHSYQPAPFFVLDEVDAALDNTNVAKIANYIRTQASDTFQFIVISLKGSLYERGNSLVGIYRDQDVNSSRTLTLDLTQYDD